MCGIAGIINHNEEPISSRTLKVMSGAIRHRGPDDDGIFVNKNVGLAFRRLAIIDLSPAGHQPMGNKDGTVLIVFNGEVYNYLELRPVLQKRGHQFRSKTDTEVVLHAYEEYGEKCVELLKGMFAFAIWDENNKKLFCARDRLGIKPFYYRQDAKSFVFASEIKAILCTQGGTTVMDDAAFNEYFTFQNIYSSRTLFSGITLLPAGHTLTVEGGTIQTRQYWDPTFRIHERRSEQEWSDCIREKFEHAVSRHLMSDVPIGSHLSGGMDSASIVAVASRFLPLLTTFTGGFDTTGASGLETFFDERSDAEILARENGTRHYEMVIHAGDMKSIMPKLIWHLEDLRLGMCYQNYFINELASKFVKVVLAGTGGDELFAGYPWRYQQYIDAQPDSRDDLAYQYWSRLIGDEKKKEALTADMWDRVKNYSARDSFSEVMMPTKGLSPVNQALYFEMKTFLHGLLIIEDKVSMAHSLESRVPFLDSDLVELALSIPDTLKFRDGKGKVILRDSLSSLLPPEIAQKKKQGFSAPEETWYRGKAYEYARDILLNKRCANRNIFRQEFIEKTLRDHHAGSSNNRLLIWSLISFEWWNRIFIDKEDIAQHESEVLGR